MTVRATVVFVALCTAAGRGYAYQAGSSEVSNAEQVLRTSTDGDVLEQTAISIVRSGNAANLEVLGRFLHDPEFLHRLDPLPNWKVLHLSKVMAALAEHPTPEVATLSLGLAEDPAYVAVDDRESFLLEIIAKVKPMGQRAINLVQSANEQGYFAFNARLLAENASPRALELFESMMLDKSVPAESRIQCLHQGIVPHRMQLPVLQAAARILGRTRERAIARGVSESLFGYRQDWFGIESHITEPPSWTTASSELLHAAASAADAALARQDIDGNLRQKILAVRTDMTNTLAARAK